MIHERFSGRFDNDHAGYIQAMNWFSCLQPPAVNESTWTACITAMGEAFENSIYHARTPPGEAEPTSVEVIITSTMIQLRIWDNGPGFNLEQRIKELPESVPLHAERGRGLWIINQIADYLNYSKAVNQLNCFTIRKFWSSSASNE